LINKLRAQRNGTQTRDINCQAGIGDEHHMSVPKNLTCSAKDLFD